MDVRLPIDPVLADVATILRCLVCGRSAFTATASALTCGGCGAQVAVHDGIPHVRAADEDPAITRERATVDGMEAVPLHRPTDFSLVTLLADRGALRDAFLALPYGDGSAFYQENEYFRNVAVFGDVFDYILAQLGPATGGRLLDVGADMTWSTARLAAAGWRAVGIDINDHLRASRLWRGRLRRLPWSTWTCTCPASRRARSTSSRPSTPSITPTVSRPWWLRSSPRCVRAGGSASSNRTGSTRPCGRRSAPSRSRPGSTRTSIAWRSGIGRFVQAGLELVTHTIGHAFNAIYRKRTDGATRTISLGDAEAEVFAGFYRGSIAGPPVLPGPIEPGARVEIPVRVVNGSPVGWSSDGQLPVRVGYRLHLRHAERRETVAPENPRASLGHLWPNGSRDVRVAVALPERPGDYEIEFDLVQEHRAWFSGQGVLVDDSRPRRRPGFDVVAASSSGRVGVPSAWRRVATNARPRFAVRARAGTTRL